MAKQLGCSGGAQLYGYSAAWQGSRLQSSADSVQNYQATYGYDEFNRLTGLNVTSGSASSYSYVYDRYGNRWQQNPSGSGPAPQLSFDPPSNQILVNGFSYDAAGNLLSDGQHVPIRRGRKHDRLQLWSQDELRFI